MYPERWAELSGQAELTVIGLMSGTSADGVDAACVRIRRSQEHLEVELLAHLTRPLPDWWRALVCRAARSELGVAEVCLANQVGGELFAEAALSVAEAAGMAASEIHLVGSHGQTVFHCPAPRSLGDRRVRCTLQVGDISVIAARTGIITVGDFRQADVAAGGQGAPLVPLVDYLLFRSDRCDRIIQNIGGIANLTWLPAGGSRHQVLAFDTGPGNVLIDAVARRLAGRPYDVDGAMARRGRPCPELLAWLLQHPYYRKSPPKSTGREEFGDQYVTQLLERARGLSPEDVVATVTQLTALTIADAYRRFLPPPRSGVAEVYVSGGGAQNPTLMEWLTRLLRPWPVRPHEELGIPGAAKEAVAFAVLAALAAWRVPGNLPQVTGASRPVVLGKVAFPP